MVFKPTVEFSYLGICQRWRSISTNYAIPDCLNEFDLLVNVEHTCLL